ncbi:hypothetical protein Airi02_081420 [Actinoallomurus iriomotensis]|uniref:LysR substrate-binding domain-containing protein n=1 Tax=Actinoallomurus iriomotensis TaxID=478107 RepID=A0A9W6SAV5_9ACTN|nr:hypothetical protein Airi02_081420 [Actinoallomurus iriomotensis]
MPRCCPSPAAYRTGPRAGSHQAVSHLPQTFKLVELGGIVAFLPAPVARRNPRSQIAYRPVSDLGPTTLAAAWPYSRSPAIAGFARAATAVAARTRPEANRSELWPDDRRRGPRTRVSRAVTDLRAWPPAAP